MLSRALFSVLCALVVGQRLWEVDVSRRHERKLLARGAIEHAHGQMPWMVALHAAWLASALIEVWLTKRPFVPGLAAAAACIFTLGQVLRWLAMRTLGERWTVKVITPVDHGEAVSSSVYRYLRHPNYVGVGLEILALPLIHGAYVTALVFSLLNAVLLRARIRAEERALEQSSDYAVRFRGRRRFLPQMPGS
jgi:methyltransferase